ncbi:DHA2 family efflux MFS transporter permease subunit [Microtetraspora sp. AC03309]|uniref:DHA2 family efflux MFS transporter permease subunit n=1 Tax=Microtetraspora sp. AC03309 TaxID=2779376 RepID=UPI001E4DD0FE|nr:DHA2 family efflux MFS transporter permease subunit [Microtetraspora sp. AC03309]MCC5576972.1 DHA2 family efflux MFS transporter permease subunit [Microtetraspora sp. AC03309]
MSPDATHLTTSATSGRTRTIALIVILLAGFMDLLDVTIVNVTVPSIRAELGASPAQVQWMLAGYTLAFALGIITGARLGELYGYRRVFLIGIAGFTAASALCGAAPTAEALVAARVVQGVFAAAMVPQVLSQIQLMYAPHERGGAMAAFSSLSGLAAAVGPILGAALLEANWYGLGWRGVFWLNVPAGILALIMAARVLPHGHGTTRPRLDLAGMLICAAGLLLVLCPLIAGSEERSWPVWTYFSLVAGVAVLTGFHRHQRRLAHRGDSPLLEVSLFRVRSVGGGLLVQFLFFVPVMGFFFTFMQLLQSGLGMAPLEAGVTILPWPIATTVAAGLGATVLLPRLGRGTVQLGLVVLAAGFALLAMTATTATPDTGWLAFLPGVVVGGAGMGLTVAPLAQLTLENVPARHAGSGSGLFNTVAQVAASVGVAIIGTIFFPLLAEHSGEATRGYGTAFSVTIWVSLALLALTTAVSFLLPRRSTSG